MMSDLEWFTEKINELMNGVNKKQAINWDMIEVKWRNYSLIYIDKYIFNEFNNE